MPSFDYHRPKTLSEAWRLARELPGSRYIAGGTDVMVRIREGKIRPSALISLNAISELASIDAGPPLRIGAGVRVADLITNEHVARTFPVLVEAGRRLGSTQIRSSATAGGNLCNASPCADLAPPLLVNEARVEIGSPSGTRSVALEDFFVSPGATRLEPGEVVTAIVVDPPSDNARAVFMKHVRVRMDIALASVAVLLALDGPRVTRARVAAGSLGPRPMRLRTVEAALEGKTLDDTSIAAAREAAAREVTPISDVRAGADYRRILAGALTERAIHRLLDGRKP